MSSAKLVRKTGLIVNQCSGGGNKKAGIVNTMGMNTFCARACTHGHGHPASTFIPCPYPVSKSNQLGGVGRLRSMTFGRNGVDGVNATVVARMAASQCLKPCGGYVSPAVRPYGSSVNSLYQ